MSDKTDPVLKNSWREFVYIMLAWAASTAYCCIYCYLYGYRREGRLLTADDIQPIFGIPSWVFWGIMAPWVACSIFTIAFAGLYMVDDDLGTDHTPELEADIREGGRHE